jgi:hypothetical protein
LRGRERRQTRREGGERRKERKMGGEVRKRTEGRER